jgi:hypothetical protein
MVCGASEAHNCTALVGQLSLFAIENKLLLGLEGANIVVRPFSFSPEPQSNHRKASKTKTQSAPHPAMTRNRAVFKKEARKA